MLQQACSKLDEWIVDHYGVMFVAIVGVFGYATFCLISDLLREGFRTPTVLSYAALLLSAYTALATRWLPPDVSVALAQEGKWSISEEERLTLLYHNRGAVRTYVTTESITCDNERIEVTPKFHPELTIEPKSPQTIPIYLRSTGTHILTTTDFPISIKVSFTFWRGLRKMSRQTTIHIPLTERS